MSQRTRILLGVTAALVVWFAFITLQWALQPLDDTMPVGKAADGIAYQHTECGTLFDSNLLGSNQQPVLITPAGVTPQWSFPRPPCELVHDQARLLFGINVAAFALGIAALTAFAWRTSRPATPRLTAAA